MESRADSKGYGSRSADKPPGRRPLSSSLVSTARRACQVQLCQHVGGVLAI